MVAILFLTVFLRSTVFSTLPRAHSVILYPLCNIQRHLSGWICSARYVQYFSACMEVFYGHFKDGTGGTRDYRFFWWHAVYFQIFVVLLCSLWSNQNQRRAQLFCSPESEIGAMLYSYGLCLLLSYSRTRMKTTQNSKQQFCCTSAWPYLLVFIR